MKSIPVALTAAADVGLCRGAPGRAASGHSPGLVQQEFAPPLGVICVQPTYAVPAVGYV